MPSVRYITCAASAGGRAYVFGGAGGWLPSGMQEFFSDIIEVGPVGYVSSGTLTSSVLDAARDVD